MFDFHSVWAEFSLPATRARYTNHRLLRAERHGDWLMFEARAVVKVKYINNCIMRKITSLRRLRFANEYLQRVLALITTMESSVCKTRESSPLRALNFVFRLNSDRRLRRSLHLSHLIAGNVTNPFTLHGFLRFPIYWVLFSVMLHNSSDGMEDEGISIIRVNDHAWLTRIIKILLHPLSGFSLIVYEFPFLKSFWEHGPKKSARLCMQENSTRLGSELLLLGESRMMKAEGRIKKLSA